MSCKKSRLFVLHLIQQEKRAKFEKRNKESTYVCLSKYKSWRSFSPWKSKVNFVPPQLSFASLKKIRSVPYSKINRCNDHVITKSTENGVGEALPVWMWGEVFQLFIYKVWFILILKNRFLPRFVLSNLLRKCIFLVRRFGRSILALVLHRCT